jgi:hypothetical protein
MFRGRFGSESCLLVDLVLVLDIAGTSILPHTHALLASQHEVQPNYIRLENRLAVPNKK